MGRLYEGRKSDFQKERRKMRGRKGKKERRKTLTDPAFHNSDDTEVPTRGFPPLSIGSSFSSHFRSVMKNLCVL
jgi:hypothetical protein